MYCRISLTLDWIFTQSTYWLSWHWLNIHSVYPRISRKLDWIFTRCTHWLAWHWLKAGYVRNIYSVYLWVSSIIWNIYLVYKVVSYSLSNIVSVFLSDYLYNVGYPISAWQTIQYCLAYAIGLARYYRSINLMEVITGIFRRKTDMHAQKLNKQMGCVLLFLGWCSNNRNLKVNTWMECVLPILVWCSNNHGNERIGCTKHGKY